MHILLSHILKAFNHFFLYGFAFCFFTTCIFPMGPGMGPGFPGIENLSPEEMQQLEQELQAAAQQIDAYVNSLSPEEQAEFQRAVAEVEQMMNSMSEEELGQFFEQIIAAEMEQQAQVQTEQPKQLQPVTFEQKPAPIVSKVPLTSAEEKALALLTSLIERTDEFLVKTDNIPDMSLRFNRWTQQNKISAASSTTWEQQKNNIIELRQQISDLKKTDLKTGKYLFLEPFIKNTALYTQLEQLNTQLQTHEPRIVVSNFGIEKLSDTAKDALQKSLSAYGTALQTTKTDVKKLFEEIGPELAKIKEEEKKLTEKAQAEAAKGRAITPGRSAGTPSMGGMYGYGRGGQEYDFGGGSPYGGYGEYGPSRGYEPETKEKPGTPKKEGKTPKAGGKKEKTEEEKEKEKDKDKKSKEDKDKSKSADQKAAPKEAPITCPVDGGEKVNGKYQLIESNYRYLAELLQEAHTKNMLNFGDLLQREPNTEMVVSILPTIERRLKRLNELITEYTKQTKATWGNSKNKYNEVMDKLAHLHTEQEDLAAFGESLGRIVTELKDKAILDGINPHTRYAYLKDSSHERKATTPEKNEPIIDLTKVKQEFPENSIASLNDIYTEWEKLNQAIPKATAPKKEEPKTPSPEPSKAQKTAAPVLPSR